MVRLILVICFAFSLPSIGKEVYTWADEYGVIHISDTPATNNATKLTLPTVSSQAKHQGMKEESKIEKPDSGSKTPPPLSIKVISPTNGETIRSNSGALNVKIELNRALSDHEKLQLLIDNKPIGALSTKKVWEIKNLDRGAHSFSIQLVVSGKVIASSSLVTVYLHQASVN